MVKLLFQLFFLFPANGCLYLCACFFARAKRRRVRAANKFDDALFISSQFQEEARALSASPRRARFLFMDFGPKVLGPFPRFFQIRHPDHFPVSARRAQCRF